MVRRSGECTQRYENKGPSQRREQENVIYWGRGKENIPVSRESGGHIVGVVGETDRHTVVKRAFKYKLEAIHNSYNDDLSWKVYLILLYRCFSSLLIRDRGWVSDTATHAITLASKNACGWEVARGVWRIVCLCEWEGVIIVSTVCERGVRGYQVTSRVVDTD